MQVVPIEGKARELSGSPGARRGRKEGAIPCVLYGGEQAIHFSTDFLSIRPLVFTSDFKLAEVSYEGKTYRSFLKDIQFHPVNDSILHADFQELKDGKKVKVEVPITLKGTPVGVKSGGALVPKLRKLKIKVIPEKMMEEIVLDITDLDLGDSLKVRDLNMDETIEILAAPGITVASVEVPRALKAAEAAEAEAAEAEAEAEAAAEEEGEGEGEEGAEKVKGGDAAAPAKEDA